MALNNKTVLSTFKEGTRIYDLVNAIRSEATQGYQDYVPLAHKDNVADLRNAFKSNQQLMNEFLNALINKVAKTVITKVMARNVLEQFKKGSVENGDTIEEVHVNLAKEHVYDAVRGETEVWKREKPDVQAFYHKRNRQAFYKQTITDFEVMKAFNSWNGVTSLLTQIVNAMYGGNRNDEYLYMKLLLESALADGAFHIIPVGDLSTDKGLKDFIEKAREHSLLIKDINHMNPAGVDNSSQTENQYIILPAKTEAKMDVNVLASAFNMDKTDFLGQRVSINYLGNQNVVAMLIDENFYMVFDHLFDTRSIQNPENLSTTFWLHVHQTLSYSPFHTAIAFMKGEVEPITSILLNPPVSVIGEDGITLTVSANVPSGFELPDLSEVTFSTNSDMVTLTKSKNKVLVKPTGTAIPGSMVTITATHNTGEGGTPPNKDYTATAQVQISNSYHVN